MTSVYGPVVTGADVEAAVRATIKLWAPAYVAELARHSGMTLAPIRYYGTALASGWPDEQLPACLVVAPGLAGPPEGRGDGYDAAWAVGVGLVVADVQRDVAVATAQVYGAALRLLLMQQGSLGGFAVSTNWVDEETDPLGYERDRFVAAYRGMFDVHLEHVASRSAGPLMAPVDPTVAVSNPSVATVVTPGIYRIPTNS